MNPTSRQKQLSKHIFTLLILSLCWFGGGVLSDLIISEVYIDGTDEWIEITNKGDSSFVGTVTISGAKSSVLTYTSLSLAPWASFLIGDQCNMLLDPTFCLRDQGLSLSDTKELKLLLTQIRDTGESEEQIFHFSQDLVVSINDKKTSLSCTYPVCELYFPTPFSQSSNVVEGIIANPWRVYENNESPEITWESVQLNIPLFSFTHSGELLTFSLEMKDTRCEQSCLLTLTGNTIFSVPVQVMSWQTWSTHFTMTPSGQSGETLVWSLSSTSWEILSGQYTMTFSLPPTEDIPTSWTDMLSGGQTWDNETENETPQNPDTTSTTGSQQNIPDPIPLLPKISLSEIHATNDTFPEYLELFISSPASGSLTIQGAGNGKAIKTISLQIISPQRLLITSEAITWVENQYILPSLSLTDGGEELTLLRQSGHQIDKAVYSDAKKWFSQYFSSFSWLDKNYTRFWPPTPGISEELYTTLFSPTSWTPAPQCEIIFQHTSPLYAHHKINLQASFNNKPLTNTSPSYSCFWSLSWSEFTGCNPSFLSFSEAWVYPITLEIFSQTPNTLLCKTFSSLNLPELPEIQSCRAEYYSWLYNNRKEKYGVLTTAIRSYGFRVSGSWTNITLTSPQQQTETKQITGTLVTWRVTITKLLPNPLGKDTWTEWIEIQTTTWEVISNSLFLSNGNRSIRFPPYDLVPGKIYSFTWNRWLLNSSACITLAWSWIIYDTYCYTTPKEWVIPPRRTVENTTYSTSIKTTISFIGDQVCAKQKGQIIVCKDLLITKAEIKDLKKSTKKVTSLEKKLTTALKRRDKHKKLSTQFTAYKKTQSAKTTQLKQHYKRATSTLYALKSHLQSKWMIAYQDPYILNMYRLFSFFEDQETLSRSLYGKELSTQDITQIQELSLGSTVYDDAYIPALIEYLVPIIQSYTHKATPLQQIVPP